MNAHIWMSLQEGAHKLRFVSREVAGKDVNLLALGL